MKNVLLLIFGSFAGGILAQQLLPIQHDTNTYSHEFIINGIADYGSTSVENNLTKKFIYGGHISEEIKDKSFSKHKGINRIGADITGEFEYRNLKANLFKKENWGFIIKAGAYNYLSTVYGKDVFGMAFYGNENYLGENINLSGTRFSAMSFQKIGFGWIDKKTKSNISLNLYNVSRYSEGWMQDGQLFQSESADSVSLTFDGSFEYSTGRNFNKGYGIGLDLDFRIPVVLRKETISYIQFTAKNIGFTYLNTPVKRYFADTIIAYDGLTFDQLYGESTIFDEEFSILDSLGIDSKTGKKVQFLPGFLQVGKIIDEINPARVQSFFGIRMYPSIAYVPMIYAGVHVKTTKWLDLGANISYGGYSDLRFGFYSQIKFKALHLGIATEDLYGMISKYGYGQSLIVRLRVKI